MTAAFHNFGPNQQAPGKAAWVIPSDFVELLEMNCESIERKLGYFGTAPIVIVGYCPGGAEVIWRDGQSSGFGAGGWRVFLEYIAPLAFRYHANIGDLTGAGTHVLLMDRTRGVLYAAPRQSAEKFFSQIYGTPPPKRPCLCAIMDRSTCPSHTCRKSRSRPPVETT